MHRLVLEGRAPDAGPLVPDRRRRASTRRTGDRRPDFLAAVDEHATSWSPGSTQGVQTNEVGRCAALAVGFTELLRRLGPAAAAARGRRVGGAQPAVGPLALRGRRPTAWGDPDAPLRFADDVYREPCPTCRRRSGPTTPSSSGAAATGRRSTRRPTRAGCCCGRSCGPTRPSASRRLDAALAVAAEVPATVDRADAGDVGRPSSWPSRSPGATTVVFHSIVLAVPAAGVASDGVLDALADAGARATPDAPLAWLRMEPRRELTEAPSSASRRGPAAQRRRLLASRGYHGRPVWARLTLAGRRRAARRRWRRAASARRSQTARAGRRGSRRRGSTRPPTASSQ